MQEVSVATAAHGQTGLIPFLGRGEATDQDLVNAAVYEAALLASGGGMFSSSILSMS
jgi:hypothetical protein